MKYMKKLMTLLAVLTLALAMAVPAFAASGTASSTGKITIDNAVTRTTYKAYRIFDLESYDILSGTVRKKMPERILQSWQRLLRLKKVLHVIRQKPQLTLQ